MSLSLGANNPSLIEQLDNGQWACHCKGLYMRYMGDGAAPTNGPGGELVTWDEANAEARRRPPGPF